MRSLVLAPRQRLIWAVGDERREIPPPCTSALIQVDDPLGTELARRLPSAGCRIFVLFGAHGPAVEDDLDWALQELEEPNEGADETDVVTAVADSLEDAILLIRALRPSSGDIVVALQHGREDISSLFESP